MTKRKKWRPGLEHAALGAAFTAVIGIPCALVQLSPAYGVVWTIAWYVSRERRQSEEANGSKDIPPWVWNDRAARDIAWPTLAAIGVALAIKLTNG